MHFEMLRCCVSVQGAGMILLVTQRLSINSLYPLMSRCFASRATAFPFDLMGQGYEGAFLSASPKAKSIGQEKKLLIIATNQLI